MKAGADGDSREKREAALLRFLSMVGSLLSPSTLLRFCNGQKKGESSSYPYAFNVACIVKMPVDSRGGNILRMLSYAEEKSRSVNRVSLLGSQFGLGKLSA